MTDLKFLTILFITCCSALSAHHKDSKKCNKPSFIYYSQVSTACHYYPKDWSKISPYCSDLKVNRQSPISLNYDNCQFKGTSLRPLRFNGFNKKIKYEFVNNGHSASFTPSSDTLAVEGGNLRGRYKVLGFHFHWGSGNEFDYLGSEHRLIIDGVERPTNLEMHIVLYREGMSAAQATRTPNGLSVIGVLFESSNVLLDNGADAIDENGFAAFGNITKRLHNIKTPCAHHGGQKKCDKDHIYLKLSDLLPSEKEQEYINYDGSLTTPGCNPVVQWHVIIPTKLIPTEFVRKFTQLEFENGDKMINNFRPTQKISGRKLRCY